LECALWCRYCYGTTDSGAEIPPNDDQWDRLKKQSMLAKDDPVKWLELGDVYGPLARDESFRQAFTAALANIWENGTVAAIEQYLT